MEGWRCLPESNNPNAGLHMLFAPSPFFQGDSCIFPMQEQPIFYYMRIVFRVVQETTTRENGVKLNGDLDFRKKKKHNINSVRKDNIQFPKGSNSCHTHSQPKASFKIAQKCIWQTTVRSLEVLSFVSSSLS